MTRKTPLPIAPIVQPVVHTVYGGAHLFKADTVAKLESKARESFAVCLPNPALLGTTFGLRSSSPAKTEWLIQTVYDKVKARLAGPCIQDFRIDFEDGFGPRPPSEEDYYAYQAADGLAKVIVQGALPHRIGIRIKSLGHLTRNRSVRTLTLFLGRLISQISVPLPKPLIVTLPKVEDKSQAALLDHVLSDLEAEFGLQRGEIKVELMVESPLALIDPMGSCPLPAFAEACKQRLLGVHIGAYDLTASLDVPGPFQDLSHPFCVLARGIMKLAFSGQPIELADGACHLIPVGDPDHVRTVWGQIYHHVTRSLSEGYYHGWDIHPAQIPPRYVALYSFFLDHQENATSRLKNLLETSTKASRVGASFDDAASGSGLLNFFRKGFTSGAFTKVDLEAVGLSVEDLSVATLSTILART